MKRLQLIFMIAALLAACAPTTTVVLIPDDDGKVGQVTVASATDTRTIDQSSAYVEVTDQVSDVKRMNTDTLQQLFGPALAAVPPKPQSYLLYFSTDSSVPLASSLKKIPTIVKAIRSASAPEVTIIGHTDHTGNFDYNERLSAARANNVRALFVKRGIDPRIMKTDSYGFRAPLVPAGRGVSEPRNRRVEVFVR